MKYRYIHTGLIQCFIILIAAFTAISCSDEITLSSVENPSVVGDKFTINGSFSLPGMTTVATRGNLGNTPGENLILTVFEFDLGESAESSYLSNIYHAELLDDTDVANNGIVRFNLTLQTSGNPKVLHFMLADRPLSASGGSVASILPTLSIGEGSDDEMGGDMDSGFDDDFGGEMMFLALDGSLTPATGENNDFREAYWGFVEFPYGYVKKDNTGKPILDDDDNMILLDGNDGVKSKLTEIPLIRNFAGITVSKNNNVKNFDFISYKIVNIPSSGTIGAWDSDLKQVPILHESGIMKNYTNLSYRGIIPGDVVLKNQEKDAKSWTYQDFIDKDVTSYIYEHPFESTRRTYILIYGIYTWTEDTKDPETGKTITIEKSEPCYYKIDIGVPDQYNNFQYYNIIRNIRYNIVINQVEAKGCSTIEDAIAYPPFNNISASTETSTMLNISDGHNLLIIDQLNHIIVDKGQRVDVLYRYIENIDKPSQKLENNLTPKDNAKTGDVIKSIIPPDPENPVDTVIDGVGWKKLSLFINNPSEDGNIKKQSFIIYDGRGLSRTINITLRQPWKYSPIGNINGEDFYATVARGSANLYDDDLTVPEDISSKKGEDFTVYFNLPNGLDETMFPLVFQLEAKNQGIENNKKGTLVVTTGPSLFDSKVTSISYLKKISYEEYKYQYNSDNQLDKSLQNNNHTIRCRFTTITNAELDNAEIKIHNPYFRPDISAIFKRVNLEDDTD